tara:strand:- start:248 stop:847 length:600 start_codon:yes stop_codon:yes gene_type:complete
VRWERFFDDLEDELASEWEAERAAVETEAERLRLSRVDLRRRLRALAGAEAALVFDLVDGSGLRGAAAGVGADWVSVLPSEGGGAVLVPLHAVAAITAPHPELLRSARAGEEGSALADRMTFGFAVRDLVRRRTPLGVHLISGRRLHGTIDRAGADHLDLALHDPGSARRADAVTGYRVIPYSGVARITLESSDSLRVG